ncbi:CDP-glycerol glycerophosphotransferase family protein [Leuconostoc fallax]|uniref:CDP-glycerol glycerophosphotransferase family protein n=1 Tax=Leuconostoc fallax TaxID=1251 RepID=UPI002090032C|nr:CDP-glycerol glycerophosphotransferase family protein [Leuconostoc fallax]MCO6183164.1 CDP-glycerol glycerophosphotransferase family protein [Leuconostoc fallax]
MITIKHILKIILSELFRFFPLKKRIVFSNFHGKLPGDNPYYIWLWAEKNKIKSIWLVNNVKEAEQKYSTYKFTKFVKFRSLSSIRALVTSAMWIDNVRKPWVPRKRINQTYIQTWHGEPLKKIEKDAVKSLNDNYLQWAKNDSKVIDYVLSGSDLSEKAFLNSFWLHNPKKQLLKIGEPRWDIFNSTNTINFNSLNQFLNINSHDKVILYMPTFRDLEIDNNIIKLNFNKLISAFDSNYKLVLRLHPNMSNDFIYEENDRIINASQFGNPQDLIARSELVITDYSSSMFDAMIANKKVILLAKDLNQYLERDRELYLNYHELPFPKFYSEEDLLEFIVAHYEDMSYFNYNLFKIKYGFIQNFKATSMVGRIIMDKFKNERK